MKREKALAKGRKIGAPLGGRAVMRKDAPADCAYCQERGYTRWAQHLGHLGFAALVRKRYGGDREAACRELSRRGLMAQDPAPWNGAWQF